MKVTFLGTGTSQGIPVISCTCNTCHSADSKDNRLRSSIMLEISDKVFVIDSGPDFRQQMLREQVKNLHAIIFTHEHKDHIAGLDDVRAFNYTQRRPMDVYAEERVLGAIHFEYSYAFAENKYPGIPEINLHPIENREFEIEGVKILPVRAMHLHLPVFGYRVEDFTYITDANFISDEEKQKIYGSKVLAINALRRKKHISHYSLSEALDLIAELKPEKAYLTHISHQLGIHEEIKKELPENVFLAYDGMKLEV